MYVCMSSLFFLRIKPPNLATRDTTLQKNTSHDVIITVLVNTKKIIVVLVYF